MGMPTPDVTPTDVRCRRLRIPNNVHWLATINGIIAEMMNKGFWEQINETDLTPEQAAQRALQIFTDYRDDGDDWCMAGRIFAWTAASPPKNALLCNGQLVNASQYPELDTLFGHDGAGKIHIPDMRARFLLGAGAYPYSADPDDDLSFGRNSLHNNLGAHTLTEAEMPSHKHTTAPHTHNDAGHTHAEGNALPSVQETTVGVPSPAAIPGAGFTGVGFANIQLSTVDVNPAGGGGQFDILPRSYGVEWWMSTR